MKIHNLHNIMNWYKWSQNERECNLGIEELATVEGIIGRNYESDEDRYQDAFLLWSRCLPKYYDYISLQGWRDPDPSRTMRTRLATVLETIARGEIQLRDAEAMSNVSRWCGAAGIRFINMIMPGFEGRFINEETPSWDDLYLLRRHGSGESLLFNLADRESLDKVFNILKNHKAGWFFALGSWAMGVMGNPNSSAEFQDFITESIFKHDKRTRAKVASEEKTAILASLMTNPNASAKSVKMFLQGNIIHANSQFLEVISDYRKSSIEELWRSKTINGKYLNPNEEIMGMISEYINRIVDQWHASMFDSMRTASFDYGRMMDIVLWINLYTKNPDTIRKNYDTLLKATKIKASPAEAPHRLEVPRASTVGLVHGDSSTTNALISTFVIKGSSLSEDELQNLMEILLSSHMENIDFYNDNKRQKKTGMWTSPIAPLVLNVNNLKLHKMPEAVENLSRMGISEKNLIISLREGLKKFRFMDFIKKIKRDESRFPGDKRSIFKGVFDVYSLRLTVVRSLIDQGEVPE